MTLIASSPTTSLNQLEALALPKDDDSQSTHSSGNIGALRPFPPPFNFEETLEQCLGFPEASAAPYTGGISVENSSNVHIGDLYQGPVTIKQVVYTNGSAVLAKNSERANDNLAFVSDSDNGEDNLKASDRNECDKDNGELRGLKDLALEKPKGFRKGFLWLQNASKHRPVEIGIFLAVILLFVLVLLVVLLLPQSSGKGQNLIGTNYEHDIIRPVGYKPDITNISQIKNKLRIVSRQEWLAQPPINHTTPLVTPVPYVIIHHTATEGCSSQSQCVFHVRHIQMFHIESQGWYDIGYNYLVGGDGAAYEGRGWTVEGAHTIGWNYRSIGIAFVGTFLNTNPPEIQLLACKRLINRGVELGYIRANYTLLGARQLSGTESPGEVLMEKIKMWPHWSSEP